MVGKCEGKSQNERRKGRRERDDIQEVTSST